MSALKQKLLAKDIYVKNPIPGIILFSAISLIFIFIAFFHFGSTNICPANNLGAFAKQCSFAVLFASTLGFSTNATMVVIDVGVASLSAFLAFSLYQTKLKNLKNSSSGTC